MIFLAAGVARLFIALVAQRRERSDCLEGLGPGSPSRADIAFHAGWSQIAFASRRNPVGLVLPGVHRGLGVFVSSQHRSILMEWALQELERSSNRSEKQRR
jgi:hypothetical protein